MKWLLTAVLMMIGMVGSAETLWWGVFDDVNDGDSPSYSGHTTVDDIDLQPFVESYGTWQEDIYEGYNLSARAKAINLDGSEIYLRISFPDSDTLDALDFFDGGGQNAAGLGTGWWIGQSIVESELLNEALFQIELGLIEYDDAFNVVGWEAVAWSDTASSSENVIWHGGVSLPADHQWTPFKFYTINPYTPPVPEPSSLLLALIGSSLLMLKRKVKV